MEHGTLNDNDNLKDIIKCPICNCWYYSNEKHNHSLNKNRTEFKIQ